MAKKESPTFDISYDDLATIVGTVRHAERNRIKWIEYPIMASLWDDDGELVDVPFATIWTPIINGDETPLWCEVELCFMLPPDDEPIPLCTVESMDAAHAFIDKLVKAIAKHLHTQAKNKARR